MEAENSGVRRIYWYILGIVAVLFLLVFFIVFPTQKQNPTSPSQPVPTARPIRGSLTLQTVGSLRKYPVGVPLTLAVIGDSDSDDIVAFDVILGYDENAFTLGTITSPISGVQTFQRVIDGGLTITAVQSLQSQTKLIFDKTTVLQATFTPKTKGTYTFSILPQKGRASTKLMNTDTKPLYPQLGNIQVEIE